MQHKRMQKREFEYSKEAICLYVIISVLMYRISSEFQKKQLLYSVNMILDWRNLINSIPILSLAILNLQAEFIRQESQFEFPKTCHRL